MSPTIDTDVTQPVSNLINDSGDTSFSTALRCTTHKILETKKPTK